MAEKSKPIVSLDRLVDAEGRYGLGDRDKNRIPLTPEETEIALKDLMECRALLYGMPYLGGHVASGQNVSHHLRFLQGQLREALQQHEKDRAELRQLREEKATIRRFLGLKEEL